MNHKQPRRILEASYGKDISVKARNSVWVLIPSMAIGLCVPLACNTRNGAVKAERSKEAQPLFTPVMASLAQQKMCDEQAAKKFRDDESTALYVGSKPLYSYTSHYDPTVNVCYVRVNSFGANSVSYIVYDAFGGRVYAAYISINDHTKKSWEVPPSECDIDIPGKPDEKCMTDLEFDALTEKYFGVTRG